MESIGSIVRRVLKNSGKEFLFDEGILKVRWREIAGDFIARNSTPDRIYNKVLYIQCFNSSFKQELFFLKKSIIEKINSSFSKELVNDIKLFYKNR